MELEFFGVSGTSFEEQSISNNSDIDLTSDSTLQQILSGYDL